MSMDNLRSFLTDIANAIRNKKGTSAAIPATRFPDEIDSITVTDMETVDVSTPSIAVSNSGLITATNSQPKGTVAGGTKTSTKQLDTEGAKTVTPSKSTQKAVLSGRFTTGDIDVAPIPSEYVIPSGTKSITSNGTYPVSEYSEVNVNVSSQSTPSGNTVSGTWYFYQEIAFLSFEQDVSFTSNGQSFVKIKGYNNELYYVKADGTEVLVYDPYNGTGPYAPWVELAYMTITFTSAQTVTTDFFELFVTLASATQSDNSSGGSEVALCYVTISDDTSNYQYYYLPIYNESTKSITMTNYMELTYGNTYALPLGSSIFVGGYGIGLSGISYTFFDGIRDHGGDVVATGDFGIYVIDTVDSNKGVTFTL